MASSSAQDAARTPEPQMAPAVQQPASAYDAAASKELEPVPMDTFVARVQAAARRKRKGTLQAKPATGDEPVQQCVEDAEAVVEEAEGWRLHLSSSTPSGYKNVLTAQGCFRAQITRNGKHQYLGTFGTAVEAAVVYARAAAATPHDPDDAEEVADGAEGWRGSSSSSSSSSGSGFKGVVEVQGRFRAQIFNQRTGKHEYFGFFDTADEAAVWRARAEAATPELGSAEKRPASAEADDEPSKRAKLLPYTPEQEAAARAAVASATAEGLPLIPSEAGPNQVAAASGFKHVKYDRESRTRPFQLYANRKSLGYFSTAEEAALAYSRSIGKDAAHLEAAEGSAAPIAR